MELEKLRHVLETHDTIRDLVYAVDPFETEPTVEAAHRLLNDPLRTIKDKAPQRNDWLLYDHCAALTRMYSIFKKFIEDLATEYLFLLPSLYPQYSDLPLRVATQHRLGVAQILQKLGKDGPYKDLVESDVIRGLALGQSGCTYTLLPEAFLIDPQNYRAEVVNRIFQYLGLDDIWSGLERHPRVIHFMDNRDVTETPRTLLKKLVDERNLASHTGTLQIWALPELRAYTEFLAIVAEVLAGLVMKSAVLRKLSLREFIEQGTVIHKFRDNIVGAALSSGEIAVGDRVTVIAKHGSFVAEVLSLEVAHRRFEHIAAPPPVLIGIKFDIPLGLGSRLVRYAEQLSLPAAGTGSPSEPVTPDDYPINDSSSITSLEPVDNSKGEPVNIADITSSINQ